MKSYVVITSLFIAAVTGGCVGSSSNLPKGLWHQDEAQQAFGAWRQSADMSKAWTIPYLIRSYKHGMVIEFGCWIPRAMEPHEESLQSLVRGPLFCKLVLQDTDSDIIQELHPRWRFTGNKQVNLFYGTHTEPEYSINRVSNEVNGSYYIIEVPCRDISKHGTAHGWLEVSSECVSGSPISVLSAEVSIVTSD